MRWLAAALVATALLGTPQRLAAQLGWTFDVGAGRAVHDPLAARLGTDNLMAGARYEGERPGWIYLSTGAPVSSAGSPWVAGGVGERLSSDALPLPLALDLGVHLFGFRYSVADSLLNPPSAAADSLAGGATLEILPLLYSRLGPVEMELQSGLVHYSLLQGGETNTRSIHHSVARASVTPVAEVEVSAEGRLVRAPEGNYPYLGGEVQLLRGPAFGWAGAGRWLSDELPTAVYGAGIGVKLGDRLSVHAAWQQEASDPLYWNAPRQSWGARLTYVLGSPAAAATPVAVPARDGRVVIRIPLESASEAPFVLGDFTGWEPVAMRREGPYWTVALVIPSGAYHYGFQTADGRWFVPENTLARVADGMGGMSAVLIVP